MKKILFATLAFPFLAFSQSLSSERIAKIKSCTVRIEIEGKSDMGTGFFVGNSGEILTCYHVIEGCIIRDSSGKYIGERKVWVTASDGAKHQASFITAYNEKNLEAMIAFDFAIVTIPIKNTSFLKLGNFDNAHEGDEVYTCGFPVAMKQPFVSKGMISTIYVDSMNSINKNGIIIKKPKAVAMLDMTLNHGNSGGAIMKVGKTVDEDEIIGLADFIVTPMQQNDYLALKRAFTNQSGFIINGINQNAVFNYFNDLISQMSIGVSGCVSINHFLTSLDNKRK